MHCLTLSINGDDPIWLSSQLHSIWLPIKKPAAIRKKNRKEEDGMLPSSQNNWACLQILLISTFDHTQLTPRISAQRLVVHHHAPPDIDIATDIS